MGTLDDSTLSAVEARLLRAQRRLGIRTLAVITTAVSIALSCLVTFCVVLITNSPGRRTPLTFALGIATFVPLIVAPLVSIVTSRLIARLDGLSTRLAHAARTDPLTNVLNRRGFFSEIATGGPNRQGSVVVVGMVDLNSFKQLNDQFGHQVGDDALVLFADQLVNQVGSAGIVGRLGGDEFAFATFNPWPIPSREQLRSSLKSLTLKSGQTFGATVGFADVCEGEGLEIALIRADLDLYGAKRCRDERDGLPVGVVAAYPVTPTRVRARR